MAEGLNVVWNSTDALYDVERQIVSIPIHSFQPYSGSLVGVDSSITCPQTVGIRPADRGLQIAQCVAVAFNKETRRTIRCQFQVKHDWKEQAD